jgi:RNA-directed DNA polymerase
MSTERQQHEGDQLDLFSGPADTSSLDASGTGGTQAGAPEVSQLLAAKGQGRALATNLIEEVARLGNLSRAMEKVCRNKGAGGVDGMTARELPDWFAAHGKALAEDLRTGRYRPQQVRGVQIPKPDGGVRQLGIPTVVDRLVQQAILQVLGPLLDPTFSASSFGFRPGRSAHQALRQAQRYVREEERAIVVDIDLEQFFDRVNHDILMARVARRIGDKTLLRLLRRFLEAGMMSEGVCVRRDAGTPQGGPLSPLLANVLLDDFDKELERRGHRFCRYADDCNIYVRTQKAGERVMTSVTTFLETKLKLRVNREKSAVAPVVTRKFLGYRVRNGGGLSVSPKSKKRLKDRVRAITKRNRGRSTERVITELNALIRGWVAYYSMADCKTFLRDTDMWIRHKLRCYRLKQLKRRGTMITYLVARGVDRDTAVATASSGKGWWRLSNTPAVKWGMDNDRLAKAGLVSLLDRYLTLRGNETAGCDSACPVV